MTYDDLDDQRIAAFREAMAEGDDILGDIRCRYIVEHDPYTHDVMLTLSAAWEIENYEHLVNAIDDEGFCCGECDRVFHIPEALTAKLVCQACDERMQADALAKRLAKVVSRGPLSLTAGGE